MQTQINTKIVSLIHRPMGRTETKLWTVPWLATRGEVLDTVKSIQVAFWSFANHLCGRKSAGNRQGIDVSTASYPLKSKPHEVFVKPNVYDGWERDTTKASGSDLYIYIYMCIDFWQTSFRKVSRKHADYLHYDYAFVLSCLPVW